MRTGEQELLSCPSRSPPAVFANPQCQHDRCCLVAVLTVKGISLQQKVNANASRLSSLDSQIEEEKQRTDDITALKEYMQTDEYIEKTAREKLGMVKDNEILFKESQSK